MHEEKTVHVDGMTLTERPEITMSNFTRVPAYAEWRKIIDADWISENASAKVFNKSPANKAKQNE